MKIAEIVADKKGNKSIILFFTDKSLNTEIKKIPGSIYYKNHKQWSLLDNDETKSKLDKLDFFTHETSYFDTLTIRIENLLIENNIICIKTDSISRYLLIKHFTHFDTKDCFSFKKFDFSKAIKVNFYYLDNYHIYIPIGLKDELFELTSFDIVNRDIRKVRKFKYTDDQIKDCLGYLTLYDSQVTAIKTCFQKVNGIIKMTTGGGKTEIFLALCKLMKLKTLILTTSIDIATQTYNRGLKADLKCGLIQGNNVEESFITISTVQSSHKLKDKYDMVIVDEVHEISDRHEKILSDKNILWRFGFSATPFTKNKLKNMKVKQYTGDIIYEVGAKVLQRKNKIAKPIITMYKLENRDLHKLSEVKNWMTIEQFFITENYERNNNIVKICENQSKQKLILIKKMKHGHELEKMLLKQGIKTKFLNGDTKKKEREEVLKEFDQNNNDYVLIGSKILFTGISIQNIYHLIIACGGSSEIEILQSLGRGLRNKTKDTIQVYDFYDGGHYITERHSKNRLDYYNKEGFDNITIKEI